MIFHSPVLLDLEFPAAFYILPAKFSKFPIIFLSLILESFSVFSPMASSQVDPIFPEGHISYEVQQGRPEHRALSTGTFIPGGTIHGSKAFLECSRTI